MMTSSRVSARIFSHSQFSHHWALPRIAVAPYFHEKLESDLSLSDLLTSNRVSCKQSIVSSSSIFRQMQMLCVRTCDPRSVHLVRRGSIKNLRTVVSTNTFSLRETRANWWLCSEQYLQVYDIQFYIHQFYGLRSTTCSDKQFLIDSLVEATFECQSALIFSTSNSRLASSMNWLKEKIVAPVISTLRPSHAFVPAFQSDVSRAMSFPVAKTFFCVDRRSRRL